VAHRQRVSRNPETRHHRIGPLADIGQVAKGLAAVDLTDMHLDHRPFKSIERVQNRNRRMGQGGRIDDDPRGLVARLMNPVDDLAFPVGLQQRDRKTELRADGGAVAGYIVQRGSAINLGLALAQKVQVRPVQDIDRFAHTGSIHLVLRQICRFGRNVASVVRHCPVFTLRTLIRPAPPSLAAVNPIASRYSVRSGGKMRILITNDDGINAPGLTVLHDIATELAGPKGEVWTVAPAFEQSGVAHCISFTKPMMIAQLGARRFAAEGSPADCVLAGLHDLIDGQKPDLVLSGINRGNNSGENALYSGTIGAALEAALHGMKAIALSQYFGPDNRHLPDPFEAARVHGLAVIKTLLHGGVWQDADYGVFYNVNFPPLPADAVKGSKSVAQGYRRDTRFGVEPHLSPAGRKYLWIKGGPQDVPTSAGTDVWANLAGYTSITPMRADLTAHDALDRVGALFQ